jgi:hypothetical protein
MTTATTNLPIAQRPTLRLKFTAASHVNSPEVKSQTPVPEPVAVSEISEKVVAPLSPPKTAPPKATTPPELNAVEIAGRARRAERRAAIDAEKATAVEREAAYQATVARRVAAYDAGKLVMQHRANRMVETLAERFPACFRTSWPRLPLKVGIDRDVISLAPDLNADDVRWAIRCYARDPAYLAMMIEGAVRVD